jgi:hypothetical protein
VASHVDECLVEIEVVPVRRARSAVASIFQAAFELRKEAHGLSEVQIGVRHSRSVQHWNVV